MSLFRMAEPGWLCWAWRAATSGDLKTDTRWLGQAGRSGGEAGSWFPPGSALWPLWAPVLLMVDVRIIVRIKRNKRCERKLEGVQVCR